MASTGRVSSSESLSAHPLLASTEQPPKYVPYTPRHRVPSPLTTTSTTLDSSLSHSPPQHQGAAASKLQSMNLKAALRDISLTPASIGWVMLEKILHDHSAHDSEWNEIWNTITSGKATLLLPLESAVSHDKITPQFVKDHVLFWDSSSRKNAQVVTLSGLRAILTDDKLTFRSSLHPLSRPFQDILGIFSRSSALTGLPSLTFPSGYPAAFPTFSLSSNPVNLPLPPRTTSPGKNQPAPRSRLPLNAPSRLSTTFTSLFGKPPSSGSTQVDATNIPSAAATPSDAEHTTTISAFTIDRHLDYQSVGQEINHAIRLELEDLLASVPSWVSEHVFEFSEDLYPLVKSSTTKTTPESTQYVVSTLQETPAAASQRFQDFYTELEQLLMIEESPSAHEDGEGDDPREPVMSEDKVREIVELVEAALCSVFYDRIYLLSTSDDASHDETLSSRIAALNMLDLTLEHLDVNIDGASHELDRVVKSCGETLTNLDVSVYTPAEKAAVLVAAHRVVVEGLAELSLIRRKSQTDPDQETPPPPPSDGSEEDPKSPEQADPVSGDMLLPMVIFSVVKANPPHLVSHLLYIQRFRNKSAGGEESYCLVNLLAVAEFLENVDLVALGLTDSEHQVLSAASLTPIPINRAPIAAETGHAAAQQGGLRGRVEQQVDAIAGSANKVILGVVDSFGMLRQLLPGPVVDGSGTVNTATTTTTTTTAAAVTASTDTGTGTTTTTEVTSEDSPGAGAGAGGAGAWGYIPTQFGLLRREAGLSIASIAASLPGARTGTRGGGAEEIGQPMVAVSRPSSVRDGGDEAGYYGEEDDRESVGVEQREGGEHDSRSIRSFESMMSGKGRERREGRKSLSDRLASVSGLTRFGGKEAETGLKAPNPFARLGSPASSRPTSPVSFRVAPPNQRLLDLTEDDIKVADVGELLREYKRLVAALRAVGGFEE